MSTAMYSLKPIISYGEQIELPQNMYKVNPINNSKNSAPPRHANEQNSKMEDLELRQQNILMQLQQLKEQMMAMHSGLKGVGKAEPKPKKQAAVKGRVTAKPIDVSQLTDIVVNASPESVPYSLLAVKNLWKDRLNISIQCYTHSTVASLSEEAKTFEKLVQASGGNDKVPKLKVVLIWKTVSFDTELIIGSDLPVLGEVNILRHLSRIGPNEYAYETQANCNDIDVVFDLCYSLKMSTTAKERQVAIKHLNNRLGKSQFYGESSELTIGDVAFGSVVKQLESVIGKDLLPNLKALLTRVCAIAKI